MTATVHPWSAAEAPTERAIRQIYVDEGLQPYAWSNAPGDTYTPHAHHTYKVLYVVRGTITFGLPAEARVVTLRAGDRLDLPPDVVHDAAVGPEGVLCLEAHKDV